MARPLDQGQSATRRDVDTLLRISRRISEDPERSEKDKEAMVKHLDAVVTNLLSGKRARRGGKTSRAA